MSEPLAQEADGADRRRYPRVAVPLSVRYLLPDGEERTAITGDLSACGAFILSPMSAPVEMAEDDARGEDDGVGGGEAPRNGIGIGTRIVAYVDKLGRIEGDVVRITPDGFGIELQMTPAKQERLAAALERVAAEGDTDALADTRRHARVDGEDHPTRLVLADGLIRSCRVIDMSIGGASLETDQRPDVGNEVRLGRMRARVVRHHDRGIGVEFLDIARSPRALINHFRAHPAEHEIS